ncbi:MAG: PilW family protein [Sulfuricaulis sp.]|uniref:PilW family protein n=1 Tax=Sulfuricaulis sp. TaxID=2003553 RepID=UPI0025FF1E53|nr:PilW family protein [Sulfuricaulis sp.]MCR4346807.1 PilW family protein [Sulfuricaulis sp.]
MKPLNAFRHRMLGLSLVELMVAITIGLIILTAVSTLFVSSKQTYTTQDSLARLQENARFAMQFLIKDIRLAGYYGCLHNVDASTTNTSLNGGTTFNNDAFFPFEGVENATGTWSRSGTALPASMKSGTDAIVVRLANESVSSTVAPGMLNEASTLNVNDAAPFATNDDVVVSDCEGADVMRVTGIAGNALQHTAGGLKKAYEPPARVYQMVTRQYFIQTKTVNGKTVPVLRRQENGGLADELVEGIESLQFLYGEDTDTPPDGVPNIYRKANTVVNWARVYSIRVGILARTIDDKNPDLDTNSYDVDGDGTNEVAAPGDRYRRRIFQATVQLRNML